MSLVPIAALGQRYGVSVRAMDSIIGLACIIHRTDYWRRGRTLDKLGIDGLSVCELTRYVSEGLAGANCDGEDLTPRGFAFEPERARDAAAMMRAAA